MVIFSGCKINIGLHITEKRTDGYHNLETVFYPVPVYDVLEMLVAQHANDRLFQTGIVIDCPPEKNFVMKALGLMRHRFPKLPALDIYLHKTLPTGGGLGGGSSNGAAALQLINQLFELKLSKSALLEMALEIGSDCPFFIDNQPCFGHGRGELLEPVPINLLGYQLLLVNPGIHINTGWAFSQITPAPAMVNLRQAVQLPVTSWQGTITNDFEAVVCQQQPAIQQVIDMLQNLGAVYAAMSGSGSTCYGVFPAEINIQIPAAWNGYWVQRVPLR